MDNKQLIAQAVEAYAEKNVAVSDAIWDYAELAYTEKKSAKELMDALAAEGFTITCPVADIPTAFTASYGSGRPVIGLLAEYDALAGMSQEAGICEPKARTEGGYGHGCGHNLLGAACLGAAVAVKKYLDETKKSGTVVFFGCPAEEGGSGKTFMARDGVFKDVDIALSWHPGDFTGITGGSMQANMQLRYEFTGKTAHAAAAPHLGRSALDAVELMDVGCNYLREHVPTTARIHYAVIDTGGTSPNVVQGHAKVVYLLRSSKIAEVAEIRERVDDIARGAALMTGTKLNIHFIKACSHFMPNDALGYEVEKVMQELGKVPFDEEDRAICAKYADTLGNPGANASTRAAAKPYLKKMPELAAALNAPLNDFLMPYLPMDYCFPGSSDVADASLNCPTVMFYVTTCAQGTPAHSWQMTAQGTGKVAHKGMLHAAKIMALTAVHYMEDPALVKEAWDEFNEKTGGKPYSCPIPAGVKAPIPE